MNRSGPDLAANAEPLTRSPRPFAPGETPGGSYAELVV